MIHARMWRSEKLAGLHRDVRYLFIGIITTSDDQGRRLGNPGFLRADIFPLDDVELSTIGDWLALLAEVGSIRLYEADGKQLIQVNNWWTYQQPMWAWPSELPAPQGWADRMRYRKGNRVVTENWDGADEAEGDDGGDDGDGDAVMRPEADGSGATAAPPQAEDGAGVGIDAASAPNGSSNGGENTNGRAGTNGPVATGGRARAVEPEANEADRQAVVAAGPSRSVHVRSLLSRYGVVPPKLDELAASHWVTPDLVESWWHYICGWQCDPGVKVRSLICRLEQRRGPPPASGVV